ncbi:hypothetical protein BJX76DRAFT_358029 [Aspergillus varians]
MLTHLGAISQLALLVAAASSHTVTDPYIATLWNACPPACESANPDDWGFYPDLRILKSCDEPMLLNLAVHNPARDLDTRQTMYACTALNETTFGNSKAQASSASSKLGRYSVKSAQMETGWRGEDASQYLSHLEAAAELVQRQLDSPASQNTTIALGYSNGVALGAYFGAMMDKSKDRGLLYQFLDRLRQGELKTSGSMMQVCDSDRPAAYNLGVVSEASEDPSEALASVQEAVATWSKGQCVQGYSGLSVSQVSVGEAAEQFSMPTNGSSSPSHQHGHGRSHGKRALSGHDHGHHDHHRRGVCRAIQVQNGNSCGSLATRCGIKPAAFTKYNPDKNLCSKLRAGQHVCCSAGSLPDYSPKPNADGTCHVYTIRNNDDCSGIAAANSISTNDINAWNKKSWGWMGCSNLQVGGKICLSKGDPPMPSVLKNAVCGPQKAGTKRPNDWGHISSLNPCPLNACCDIWGQCGTTEKFCTATKSSTGAPGTAKQGTNGCISNCGTDIVYNNSGFPGSFDAPIMVGYYEAFQNRRPCLNMDVSAIENEIAVGSSFALSWDHIHFAFANITKDFEVDVTSVQDEFTQFIRYPSQGKNPKVLSFGGWSFSTDLDSYAIFRNGVTDQQRSLFASNVVKFANDHDLDGLDFDWEYPSAPDIPGIPKGDSGDGERYLKFLKEVWKKLSSEKTLSIAAPSSYWYLKGFPIKEISEVENPNAAEGYHGGSCLRSHVNYTETTNSLSMITKAGVPNSKIVAGLASYGRSRSTISYSANGTWVAYNTESERNDRITDWHSNRTVLGTSLWAIDLTDFVVELPSGQALKPFEAVDCTDLFDNLDDLEAATGIDDYCINTYLMQAINGNLTASLSKYQDLLDHGYDDQFNWYKKAVHASAPRSLQNFLKHHASEYFTCTGVIMSPITQAPDKNAENKTTVCPYESKDTGYAENWWEVKDKSKFEADILSSAGISPDWLYYGVDGSRCVHDPLTGVNQCSGSRNMGMPSLEGGYTISNPKEIISARLPNITTFQGQLDFIAMLSANNAYDGDTSDVVDGASMLAFMVSQSVTSMSQVAKVGEEYKEDWIKEVVLLFVTGVLMLIPGLGELAESADLAAVAATLRILGDAGDVGMSVYDIVSSKDAGPAAIFLSLLGGIGALDMIRAPEYFGKAAQARRGMNGDHFRTLGHEVQGGMGQVDKLIARCL